MQYELNQQELNIIQKALKRLIRSWYYWTTGKLFKKYRCRYVRGWSYLV